MGGAQLEEAEEGGDTKMNKIRSRPTGTWAGEVCRTTSAGDKNDGFIRRSLGIREEKGTSICKDYEGDQKKSVSRGGQNKVRVGKWYEESTKKEILGHFFSHVNQW